MQSAVAFLATLVLTWSHTQAITPEAYSNLDPDLALELPMVEALPVFGWSKKEFYFIVENALIDLRYYYKEPSGTPSKQLTESIRAFQMTLGHRPSGSLKIREFVDLMERTNAFSQVSIMPPSMSLFKEDEGVVSAEGTWVSERVPDPDPVQTTMIRCRQDSERCWMSTAKIRMEMDAGAWFHSNSANLEVRTVELKITLWNPQRVEAQYRPYICVLDTLVLDLRAREVAMFRDRASADAGCTNVEVTADRFKLIDGYANAESFWDKRHGRAHLLRSKAFRKSVEELQRGRLR